MQLTRRRVNTACRCEDCEYFGHSALLSGELLLLVVHAQVCRLFVSNLYIHDNKQLIAG